MSAKKFFDHYGIFNYNRHGTPETFRDFATLGIHTMSYPGVPSEQTAPMGRSIEHIFDVDDTAPYETQRVVQRYLSQETRHTILQVILGHPAHLVSLTEFNYYISKSRSTISEQLENLASHELLTRYHHDPNADSRDIPAAFWGYTPFGVELLAEYNYLRGLPVMRAAHDGTHKTEAVQRHENAPRPDLPEQVTLALSYDEPAQPAEGAETPGLSDLREQTLYADAAPADPAVLNVGADGERTIDELFD